MSFQETKDDASGAAKEDLQTSEIRYRRLFESARDGILILDAVTRKITDANPFMSELLGYSREEFLGKELWEIGLLKDEAESAAAFRQLQQTDYIRYEDLPLETSGGKRREVEFISNVYTENDRQVIQCNIRDITERKQNEQKMRLQELAIAAVKEGVILCDAQQPECPIIFTNPAFERLTGYSFEEAEGRNCRFLEGTETDPETVAEMQTAVRQNRFFNTEILNYRKDGTAFWNEVNISPIRNKTGVVTHFVGIQQDVTERRQAAAALRESEQRYRLLFESNPLPMWVYDLESLGFLAINDAAVKHYGYSREEFLSMTIKDIRPPAEVPNLLKNISKVTGGVDNAGVWKHCRKDGAIIDVEITSHGLIFDGRRAELILANDITERLRTEESLQRAEANYRNLVELSPAIVYLAQPFPPYSPIYVSPSIEVLGYSSEEWFSQPDLWFKLIYEDDRPNILQATENAMNRGLETDLEYRVTARDGRVHWLHDKGRFISDNQGNKIGWQGVMVDITKTKNLEEQLRQSQKLESIGLLAGGIAHDFNNMLTAINGYSDLALRRLQPDDNLRRYIEEIKKAGERSAVLTHQLLAFSRQQILQPKILYLNQIVTDTGDMLQRLIGEDIQLVTILHPKAGPVNVDPGQIAQVVMNLAVNARDAMPHGGKLTIETSNVYLDEQYVSHHGNAKAGEYVLLAVSDTGTGIDEATRRHIFEPFYTTKEIGKGTGLGLATVYGIVKQSGGNIWVYSEIGFGTTFKIYLPRVIEESETIETKQVSAALPPGTETILLVEDEDVVRILSRQILEMCGYTVLEAANGTEALAVCENHDCKIDLLMTDVVMPQMGGKELAERFAQIYPRIRVLFTSGYTDDAVIRHGVINADTNFIQKPFTPNGLAHKVREVLNVKSELAN